MADLFPKESAWAQPAPLRDLHGIAKEANMQQIRTRPVDGKVITSRLKEAVEKQAGVTEYEIMTMRSELETALTALRVGDVGSATRYVQRVHDDLLGLIY